MKYCSVPSRLGHLVCLFLFFQNTAIAQWTPAASPGREDLYTLANANGVWIALAESGLYRSTDDGRHWDHTITPDYYRTRICADGNFVWAFDGSTGLLRSADQGLNWSTVSADPPGSLIPYNMLPTDKGVFLSTSREVLRYDKANPSFRKQVYYSPSTSIIPIAVRGGDLWLAASDSLLRSSDGGDNWTLVKKGWAIRAFDINGDDILAYTLNGVWHSADYGNTWTAAASLPANCLIRWQEDRWFAYNITQGGILYSTDAGQSWQTPGSGVLNKKTMSIVAKYGGTMLAIGQGLYDDLLRSDDGGQNWTAYNNGFKQSDLFWFDTPELYTVGDHTVFFNYFSSDNGQTWYFPVYSEDNYPAFTNPVIWHQGAYYGINSDRKIYRSVGDLHHWTLLTGPLPNDHSYELLSTGSRLFRIDRSNSTNASSNIYESTDGGVSWSPVSVILPANTYDPLIAHGGYLFRWQGSQGLFRSSDGGANWQSTGAGLGGFIDFSDQLKLYSDGSVLYVYGYFTIAASTNSGLTFSQVNKNLLNDNGFQTGADAICSTGGLLVAANGNGVFVSQGLNDQWHKITANLAMQDIFYPALTINNDRIFIASRYFDPLVWTFALADLNLAQFSGKVWRDENQNGQQDAGELPYAGAMIQAGSASFATSKADGSYLLNALLDHDTLRVIKPAPWVEAFPAFYVLSGSAAGRDFGLYFPPDITDLQVTQTNVSVFRLGFEERIYLQYGNVGTATADARLRFVANAPLEYLTAYPAPDETTGDTLVWNLQNLLPQSAGSVIVAVITPVGAPLGSFVTTYADITPGQADANISDNTHILTDRVVGSFDPNDKRCEPDGNISPAQVAAREALTFTIRFQNTGNYPADFVRIADTLSNKLDVSTFQMLASSHPCTFDVRYAGIVDFLFDSIDLPPASVNEPASHGFAKYSIRPKAGLALGEKIRNTAFIYFDFNPAIVTNTTETVVALPVDVSQPAIPGALSVFPNPSDGQFWVTTQAPGFLRVFDVAGYPVFKQNAGAGRIRVDLSGLPAGIYLIRWQGQDGGSMVGKVVRN